MSIEVTRQQLYDFSEVVSKHLERETALDEFIPLPGAKKQLERISEAHEHRDETYWEIEGEHGHGWCCGYCGTVIQWG